MIVVLFTAILLIIWMNFGEPEEPDLFAFLSEGIILENYEEELERLQSLVTLTSEEVSLVKTQIETLRKVRTSNKEYRELKNDLLMGFQRILETANKKRMSDMQQEKLEKPIMPEI